MAESSPKTPKLRKPRHGRGKLRIGNPGNSGGGRPPNEFKREMARLASSDEMLEHVEAVLGDPDHPQWLGAWKWATERGYGKVPLEVTGEGGGPVEVKVTHRIVDPDAGSN